MINNGKLHALTIGFSLLLLISPFSSFSSSSNCIDLNTGKEVRVHLEDYTSRGLEVSLSVATANDVLKGTFYNLTRFWDGHNQGMLSGEGISILYKNSFGNKSIQKIDAYVAYKGSKQPGQGWIKSFSFDNCPI